jgi:hypothetical protein
MMTMSRSSSCCFFLFTFLLNGVTMAFVAPQPFDLHLLADATQSSFAFLPSVISTTILSSSGVDGAPTTALGAAAAAAANAAAAVASSDAVSTLKSSIGDAPAVDSAGIFDTLKNIAFGGSALLFLFAGLTFLTAGIVMPAAAKELEKECLELNPALWQEYQLKLKEGETMDRRPELMQELGLKLQPLLDKKIAAMAENNQKQQTQLGNSQWGGEEVVAGNDDDDDNTNGSSEATVAKITPTATTTTSDDKDDEDLVLMRALLRAEMMGKMAEKYPAAASTDVDIVDVDIDIVDTDTNGSNDDGGDDGGAE